MSGATNSQLSDAAQHTTMRIGQVADRVGVNTKTIRYYESIELLPEPMRNAAGYRMYTAADAERLSFIRTAQRLGLTLDEIREVLVVREQEQTPCGYVLGLLQRHASELDQRITEMQQLRDELTDLVIGAGDYAGAESAVYCGVIQHRAGAINRSG
ncbi:heavy metal-responsive transcriptional regulator [Euzebya sp.]